MKTEFEVVFTEIDRASIVNKIKALNGICIKENTLMKRVVFDNPLKLEGFGSSFQIYENELGIDFDTMNSLEEITFNNIPKKN